MPAVARQTAPQSSPKRPLPPELQSRADAVVRQAGSDFTRQALVRRFGDDGARQVLDLVQQAADGGQDMEPGMHERMLATAEEMLFDALSRREVPAQAADDALPGPGAAVGLPRFADVPAAHGVQQAAPLSAHAASRGLRPRCQSLPSSSRSRRLTSRSTASSSTRWMLVRGVRSTM